MTRSLDRLADLSDSPGGRFAVVLQEEDHLIARFTLSTRQLEPVVHDPDASAAAISVDGMHLAAAGVDGVNLWDADTSAPVRRFEAPATSFVAAAISSEVQWLAAGAIDGSIWLWETATGRLIANMNAHSERVPTLAFSTDSQLLASGGWDARVRVFDLSRLARSGAELARELEASWGIDLGGLLARYGTGL